MALEMSAHISCGLRKDKFQQISDYVSMVSGRQIGDSKPVTGRLVYTHESGIHTNSLNKNRRSYQLIDASEVGRDEDEFVIGKHSGKATICHFLTKLSLHYNDEICTKLLNEIKITSDKLKRSISPQEFYDLYSSINAPIYS